MFIKKERSQSRVRNKILGEQTEVSEQKTEPGKLQNSTSTYGIKAGIYEAMCRPDRSVPAEWIRFGRREPSLRSASCVRLQQVPREVVRVFRSRTGRYQSPCRQAQN